METEVWLEIAADEAEGLVNRLFILERGRLQLDEVLSAETDVAALQTHCAPFLDVNT